jgi:hypothetical protein
MQHPAKVYYLRVDRVRLPDVPPYGVEYTVMVDRCGVLLRDWQLRQVEGNARAMSDGACVASVVRCWVAGGV